MKKLSLNEPLDITIESQKLLSCVARFQQINESCGINYIVKVLCGSRYLVKGHSKLSTYGIGKDEGERFWKKLNDFLLENQFVEIDYIHIAEDDIRPVLSLNHCSWQILKGTTSVLVRSESWKESLINSQTSKLKLKRSDYSSCVENNESSMNGEYNYSEDYGNDFSQDDQDYTGFSYDSYILENGLDYGYLGDMTNYDAY